MSYELEAFKIGLVVGYIFIWCIMALICIIYYMIMEKNHNKFLLETKQHQKYAEWLAKNRVTLKLVKN